MKDFTLESVIGDEGSVNPHMKPDRQTAKVLVMMVIEVVSSYP